MNDGKPQIDWMQYRLNGSYCMQVEDERYCGRARKWPGHAEGTWPNHPFVEGAPPFQAQELSFIERLTDRVILTPRECVEIAEFMKRVQATREYLEDVIARSPGVNDKSLVAANALNELNGAVIKRF